MDPLVSVIIPFYNCPYLPHAIESALRQTYGNVEIIVVDDGSAQHRDSVRPYLHRIKYVRKSNGGTATALNTGISRANGEYIAWLSSDDCMKPEKLRTQVNHLRRHGGSVCFTDYDLINASGQVTHTNVGIKFGTVLQFYTFLLSGNPINGCTVMLRKDLITKVGFFNPSFRYIHDYEMWLRIILTRADFHYLNESLTLYRRHEAMGSIQHQAIINAEIDRLQKMYRDPLLEFIKQLERQLGS
jgi:teichuronic acid biosynthesis glycosyltransferase TuaG